MNMEAKRGKMAARRRHRITALRNSSEEEGRMELQKIVRSRERERVFHGDGVGDQDQELLNGRKRRRNEKQLERNKHKDVRSGGVENEGSSGSSNQELNYEDYDYEEPSSSMSNYALRKTVTPIRNVRLISGLEMAAEMISVEVPRRARSASVKRKNEQWTSSPWEFGFGERCQSRRPSPMGGSVSLRKKMKPKGLFSRVPSIQDDIEIEVVEALFDLMKQSQSQLQSQSSKKDERISDHIHTKKLDLIGNKDFHAKSECSPAVSAQIGPAASNLPPGINSELSTENQLKIGKMSSGTLKRMGEIKISLGKGKESNKAVQERITSRSCGQSNGDCSADSTLSKENLASEVVKPKTGVKFETDLMAPPPTPSSPDRHGSNIIVPSLKLDLGKPEQANVISCSYINLKERERNHCVVCDSERQNFGNPLLDFGSFNSLIFFYVSRVHCFTSSDDLLARRIF